MEHEPMLAIKKGIKRASQRKSSIPNRDSLAAAAI
jgi:hypothetical protein